MMPLWLDIEDFADDEVAASDRDYCPFCMEPIEVCWCGYYPKEDEESEEEDGDDE